MRDNISPEERLLRLIKGAKKQDIPTDKKAKASIPGIKPISRFNLQKIIIVIFSLSCLYLILSLIYPLIGLRKIRLPKVTPQEITEAKKEAKPEIKPYEFY